MTDLPIRRVAVIGAGVSGVLSAGHLIAAGLEVVVFERNSACGGVWLYDERKPLELAYPSMKPSRAEVPAIDCREDEHFMLKHAPPGPCYINLKTNVPSALMKVSLNQWPPNTPIYVHHSVVRAYIQEMSAKAKVHDATLYGAQVERVEKQDVQWGIKWATLEKSKEAQLSVVEHSDLFDAVVIATGHYHAPRIPDIPGLAQIKSKWPSRVMHSKEYRFPEVYANKKILMIGGGVSSVDIANDISPFADTIYQTTRNSRFDLDPKMLPKNATRVDEVSVFELHDHSDTLSESEPLPISIQLATGKRLHGIDMIMLCTGYHITLPFMQDYHSDETSLEDANEKMLVTDGTQVHNLHKDIFYMPDPTLAFVGLPYYTFTFSIFDFQAITVAQVFLGIVKTPSEEEMREEYQAKVDRVGLGKTFHSIQSNEEGYVGELLDWVNADRAAQGLELLDGFSPEWYAAKEELRERYRSQFKVENPASS